MVDVLFCVSLVVGLRGLLFWGVCVLWVLLVRCWTLRLFCLLDLDLE